VRLAVSSGRLGDDVEANARRPADAVVQCRRDESCLDGVLPRLPVHGHSLHGHGRAVGDPYAPLVEEGSLLVGSPLEHLGLVVKVLQHLQQGLISARAMIVS